MIDEQRLGALNYAQKRGDELLQGSLAYERAKARIETVMQEINAEKRKHYLDAALAHETPDSSYDLALEELRYAKNRLGAKSDELWTRMEECTELFGPGLERLANAVLKKAALDYEAALCGAFFDNEAEMRLIEKFAAHGSEAYTTLNFSDVLGQIRRIHKEKFVPHCGKIVKELRAEKTPKYRHSCDLCGGGLYYVRRKGGNDIIRCTSCELFYPVKKEKKRGEKLEK